MESEPQEATRSGTRCLSSPGRIFAPPASSLERMPSRAILLPYPMKPVLLLTGPFGRKEEIWANKDPEFFSLTIIR